MAQIFKVKKAVKTPAKTIEMVIDKLDHQGLGFGRLAGKAVFVAGALPGERVAVKIVEQKKQYAKAELQKVISPSAQRIAPACPHYARCGGCSLQTLAAADQAEYKQAALLSLLQNFSHGDDITLATPILSQPWQYRRAARLSVMFDRNLKQLVFGFRERNSKSLVAITECPVLLPVLSTLITPLRELLASLSIRRDVGHIELFAVESGVICLWRILKPLTSADQQRLQAFAEQHNITVYLQPQPDTVVKLYDGELVAASNDSWYLLQAGALQVNFTPGNFIQVNPQVNEQMVAQAIDWLALSPQDRVLDLFCGGGNFSLPIAQRCHSLVGVEGVDEMVRQAQANAKANHISNAQFYQADLSSDFSRLPWAKANFDKVLLDPARAGAAETLQYLEKLKANKIVYVSCNPATLARDSKLLTQKHYKLTRLGMIDMFPQTGHVESMALFERC